MIKTLDEVSISDRLFQKEGEEVNVAKVYFAFMNQFRFFYQDTMDIIRAFPEIGKQYEQHAKEEINIVKNILYMQVGKGTLKPEPLPGLYHTLADTILQTLHFWFNRKAILGHPEAGLDNVLQVILHLVYPYVTDSKKAEGIFKEIEISDTFEVSDTRY
jgi:hypothetical protein